MLRSVSRFWVLAIALAVCRFSLADETDLAVGIGDEALAELGQQWAAAINLRDPDALGEVFDVEALATRAAATVFDSAMERNNFVAGFVQGSSQLWPTLLAQIEAAQGQARFLRVHSYKGMRGPLVRYDLGEQGYNYVLLIAADRGNAGARAVDMFIATNGQRFSDTLGAISTLVVSPSNSLVGRLFGLTTLDRDLAATFRALGEAQRVGKYDKAYSRVLELPDEIRNHRVMLNLSVQLASLLSEDLYRDELARLARHHKDDPTAAFMLIDYFFYEGDHAAAMESILGLERAFGSDAAIAMLKANLALEAGETTAARKYAEHGVELEPENEAAQWTLVTVYMIAEQYGDGVRVLETLEHDFGYEFDATSFTGNEVYAGFIRSEEYGASLGAE